MAARKKGHRQRRRRGRFGILYKLLSFLIIFAAVVVGCVVFFRVNEVTVQGNSRYTTEEIIAASGVNLGDNLFLINNPQTVRAITRALPYVEKVTPVKRLPDTLEIHVTESRACAYLVGEEGYWLINPSGKVVEMTREEAKIEGLPRVVGLETVTTVVGAPLTVALEEQLQLEGLKSLLTALKARNMVDGVKVFVDLSSANAIYFDYGDDLTVVIPVSGDGDFDRRVASLKGVLDTCAKQGQLVIGTLDLTYGDETAHILSERWLPDYLTLGPDEGLDEVGPADPESAVIPDPEN